MTGDKSVIVTGDALKTLQRISDNYIDCCVTSPPYLGLRDYGAEGQIGLESSLEEYTRRLVEVFREVRRTLRPDGTLWLNLGDTYSGSKAGTKEIPAKNLMGIPWRIALALQEDGWYLRQDIVWYKPNTMPESVKDRFTKSHEYIFLLTKQPKYYFDGEAVKEPAVGFDNRPPAGSREQKRRTLGGEKATPERSEAAELTPTVEPTTTRQRSRGAAAATWKIPRGCETGETCGA